MKKFTAKTIMYLISILFILEGVLIAWSTYIFICGNLNLLAWIIMLLVIIFNTICIPLIFIEGLKNNYWS